MTKYKFQLRLDQKTVICPDNKNVPYRFPKTVLFYYEYILPPLTKMKKTINATMTILWWDIIVLIESYKVVTFSLPIFHTEEAIHVVQK